MYYNYYNLFKIIYYLLLLLFISHQGCKGDSKKKNLFIV